MMMMDETITGSSAPMVTEMSSCGIARAKPERRVTIPTPLMLQPPPIQITIKNGTIRSGIKDTMELS